VRSKNTTSSASGDTTLELLGPKMVELGPEAVNTWSETVVKWVKDNES